MKVHLKGRGKMEFHKGDKVVNVKTGEFAVFVQNQDVTTAAGGTFTLYEIQLDVEGAPRKAWKADEIAHWAKAVKPGMPTLTPEHPAP